ncbi:MAG: V-type ATP synthase subunit I [Treponema sp.]|jgi:V/A-type H+-transporting ATPase subunit I|nr:V-type ATP synthase subunit I [Treponema sp.]
MIVPMMKVSIVVMDKEKEKALEQLRDLGVLHLERKAVQSEDLSRVLEKRTRMENALGLLRPYAEDLKRHKKAAPKSGVKADADSLAGEALALVEEKKGLQEQLLVQSKEQSRLAPWGDFEPAGLAELREAGITLILYELSPKAYEALGEDAKVIVLGRDKTTVRLAALEAISGAEPFTLPDRSLSGIGKYMAEIRGRLEEIEGRFRSLAPAVPVIAGAAKELQETVEFESARAGMDVLVPGGDAPEDFAERTVSWISGYAPKDRVGLLKRGAAEYGWALVAVEPGPDDPVPTLLKNNKFVNLINPLTDFLEVTPGYNEVDISLWFLLFFTIFFGMIFGDAGYGAIVLTCGIIGIIKTAKKGVPPVFKLLFLLGLSNFIWGVLTCSWFALPVDKVPELLRNISLPLISNVTVARSARDEGLVQQNLMIFCFSLALLQLSIGHIIAIIKTRTLKALGDLGSIMMLGGMYCIILNLIASNQYRQIPLYTPAVYVFAGGFVLNFIFAAYEGSVGRSVLESLKNIISVILGIANVFSDIMSYIRLWAVGLAGAAIANTVNTMAGPMLGHFILFVFGITLLVFGHGLNLVLNVLSVLVHGVRLNTLEFSGHAGLTWAGTAYRPFAKRIKNEAQSL